MDAGKLRSGHGAIKLHLLGRASVPVTIVMIFFVFLVMTSAGCRRPSPGTEKGLVPSYGEGSYEMIIFTDYFCPPCQALESELDPILNELMEKGGVKITFVDAPVSKHTQQYIKYFLYSVNAGADFKGVLRIRHVLFSAAKTNAIFTEESIASELRGQGIAFQPYDLTKVYTLMNELMKQHNIRSTPTCVVRYSDTDVRYYAGPKEIKGGLSLLLSAAKPAKR
jgi:thiol-disulfide isomerase/thioredoxin